MQPLEPGASGTAAGPFVRSVLTSAVATGVDFALASVLVTLDVAPVIATFFGCVVGGVVAFGMNREWAFRAQGRALPQLLRFLGVWASSALLNSAGVGLVMRFATGTFGYSWLLVRAVVYSSWNYPMLRWFVFPARPREVVTASNPPES